MRVTENVFLQVCVQRKSLQSSVMENVPRARVRRIFSIAYHVVQHTEKISRARVETSSFAASRASVEHPQNKSTLTLFLS